MPIPKPKKDEKKDDFISRCMGDDVMNTEYPDQDQRMAVCSTQWRNKDKKDMKLDTVNIGEVELHLVLVECLDKCFGVHELRACAVGDADAMFHRIECLPVEHFFARFVQ